MGKKKSGLNIVLDSKSIVCMLVTSVSYLLDGGEKLGRSQLNLWKVGEQVIDRTAFLPPKHGFIWVRVIIKSTIYGNLWVGLKHPLKDY